MYGIHGTDIPWGVGMKVSHGCVRLYPEDIERLLPLVPIGTPGEFIYQPVKIGMRGGIVYGRVDQRLLLAALEDPSGIPIPVSPEPSAPAEVSPASAVEPNEVVEGDVDRAPHPGEGQAGEGR